MTSTRHAVRVLFALCLAPLLALPACSGAGAPAPPAPSDAGVTRGTAAVSGGPGAASTAEARRGWPGGLPRPGASTDPVVTGGPSRQVDVLVGSLLRRRAAAVRAKDREAWRDTAGEARGRGSREGDMVFDRLVQLPFSLLRYDSARVGGGREGHQRKVTVRGTYALGRFGGDRSFRETLVLEPSVGDTPAVLRRARSGPLTAPWQLPGMRVVRGGSGLVLGNAAPARLRAYARLADRAVRIVDDHWSAGWSRAPVLLLPSSKRQFARLTGRSPSGAAVDQLSAVTSGPLDDDGRAVADQVVVNPATWSGLTPQGRLVVVIHEVTHVATRATTTAPVPLWLSEGYAEHVAYSAVSLPASTVAADLLGRVRAGRGPTGLPADSAFDPGSTDLPSRYQAAWLLCRHVAHTHGERALVRLYREVSTGTPLDRATHDVLGVSTEQLTTAWLAALRRTAER